MMAWVIDCVAEAPPGPVASPSPSVSTPRPTTKMMTKMSFETMRAIIVSIQRRTQAVEMSAVAPAKAKGANTAVTMMRSLRTIMAPHTTMTAPSTMRARTSTMAGLVAALSAVAEQDGRTHLRHGVAGGHLHEPGRQGVGGGEKESRDGDGGHRTHEGDEEPFDGAGQATSVAPQHRGDDLDEEQAGGDDDRQGAHDGQVPGHGRPGERDSGGPADLAPQPVHRITRRVPEVLGDVAESGVGNRTRRVAGQIGQAPGRVGERAAHQSTVQSPAATAP